MAILTAEIRAFVNQVKLGFAATVCPDGTPNLSPKGTTIAWDEHHLAFADIHSPGTVQNLVTNPVIEINVVDVFTRKGYRFRGRGEVHAQGALFDAVTASYRDAGSRHIIQHIVLVKIERVIPILSPAYDLNPSEAEITRWWIDYWESIHSKK